MLVRVLGDKDHLKGEGHKPWYLRRSFPDVAPKAESSDLPLLDAMREGDLSFDVTILPDGRTLRAVNVRIGIEHQPDACL